MTASIRRQLTLFVDPEEAIPLEQIRQQFNPKQYEIIKAHVTLCREDEIENLERVTSNLFLLQKSELVIEFSKLSRFDNGKGLFLLADKNKDFNDLRKQVLRGIIINPRKQKAHITLMHPRNSTCTDEIFSYVESRKLPTKLRFIKISLIEQKDSGQWNIVQEYYLTENNLS